MFRQARRGHTTSAPGPKGPRGQRLHTHTHTHSHTAFPSLPRTQVATTAEDGTVDKNEGDPYDYWVQHVTNAADVLATGVAPIVEDKGPYRFVPFSKKYDVSFTDDVKNVDSAGDYRYVAAESCKNSKDEKSPNCVDENDMITSVNPNYLGFMSALKAAGTFDSFAR